MDKKTMQLWTEYVAEVQARNSEILRKVNEENDHHVTRVENIHRRQEEMIQRKNDDMMIGYGMALQGWQSKSWLYRLFRSKPVKPYPIRPEAKMRKLFEYWVPVPIMAGPTWEGFMTWCADRYRITPLNKKETI